MKKSNLTALILLALLLLNCKTSTEYQPFTYSNKTIDTMDDYEFADGNYYEYSFSSFDEKINPEKEIKRIQEQGVTINQAWYRNSLRGCHQPGSSSTTNTIYTAVFIVLITESNNIDDPKYKKLTNSPYISCGYDVLTYILDE